MTFWNKVSYMVKPLTFEALTLTYNYDAYNYNSVIEMLMNFGT